MVINLQIRIKFFDVGLVCLGHKSTNDICLIGVTIIRGSMANVLSGPKKFENPCSDVFFWMIDHLPACLCCPVSFSPSHILCTLSFVLASSSLFAASTSQHLVSYLSRCASNSSSVILTSLLSLL